MTKDIFEMNTLHLKKWYSRGCGSYLFIQCYLFQSKNAREFIDIHVFCTELANEIDIMFKPMRINH